jgi:sugar phosphate isomerase/epimerase
VTPTVVIHEWLASGRTLAQRMEFALESGFDGLEVRDATPDRMPELREAVAVGGIIPTSVPPTDGFIADFDPRGRRRAVQRVRRELDGIAELGGYGVITPAAWGMWTNRLPPFDSSPRTPEEDHAILVEQVAELGEYARQAGVVLLLEPLNRYEDHMLNTVAQACEVVVDARSDGARVLADTYHMNIEEDDPCASLRAGASWLGAVHLSDSNRHQPGEGHVDFAATLGTLRDIGFAGRLSVECRLRGEPEQAVPRCGAFLRALLADWT